LREKTVTKTETERSPAPRINPACRVCSHPLRRDIEHDLFLADKSPRHIAELVPSLSRRQIQRHQRDCALHPQVRKQLFERMVHSALLRKAHAGKLTGGGG
jgi:hypothetical protein